MSKSPVRAVSAAGSDHPNLGSVQERLAVRIRPPKTGLLQHQAAISSFLFRSALAGRAERTSGRRLDDAGYDGGNSSFSSFLISVLKVSTACAASSA
jgi:hypothetical protein